MGSSEKLKIEQKFTQIYTLTIKFGTISGVVKLFQQTDAQVSYIFLEKKSFKIFHISDTFLKQTVAKLSCGK